MERQHKFAMVICVVSVIAVFLVSALSAAADFIYWEWARGTDYTDRLWEFAFEFGYRDALVMAGIWLFVSFFLYMALFKIGPTRKKSGKITSYIVATITILYCVVMFFGFEELL
jgi:hypothetical protein